MAALCATDIHLVLRDAWRHAHHPRGGGGGARAAPKSSKIYCRFIYRMNTHLVCVCMCVCGECEAINL